MANQYSDNYIDQIKQVITQQIQTRIDVLRLEAAEKAARISGGLISGMLIGMVAFFVMLFISLMAGYVLAHYTGNNAIGFGGVALLYLIILLWLLWKGRKIIAGKVADSMIEQMFAPPDDEQGNA